jgi:protein ImuB
LDAAAAFSPRVEDTAPGTVIFDAAGLERLFGPPDELARKVFERLRDAGIDARVAVAANPDAAAAAARGFAGATALKKGEERRRLQDLPLDVLAPSPETAAALARWGIATLGELARLPAVQIAERLGQEGVRLHTLARGAHTRDLVPYRAAARYEERIELDDAATTLEPINCLLSAFTERLCRRLEENALGTNEVRLTLGLERRPHAVPATHARTVKLPLAVRNPRILARLLILDLEAHPPQAAVASIALEAVPVRIRALQNGLFTPLAPEPEKLELTMARIRAVVGEDRIGSPEPLDTHRPDAFRMRKFDAGFQAPATPAPPPPLALRRFHPAPATVTVRDGVPSRLAFQDGHGPIVAASGPWKTSGAWWNRERGWDREEWDVEALDALYRIRRDTASGRWFVDGAYD